LFTIRTSFSLIFVFDFCLFLYFSLPHLYPPPPRGRGRIKEGGKLRKKIPIPHLSPPPSQREGGGLGEGAPPLSSPSNTDEIGRVIYFFEGPPPLSSPPTRRGRIEGRSPSVSSPLEKGEDSLPQILPLPPGGGGFRWGRDY